MVSHSITKNIHSRYIFFAPNQDGKGNLLGKNRKGCFGDQRLKKIADVL